MPVPRAGTRQQRGYGVAYQIARTRLLAGNPDCTWCAAKGIKRKATTADHDPPIVEVGYPHLSLVPSCGPCNFGRTRKDRTSSSRVW